MEIWQVLEKAATYIEEKGWCQETLRKETGEVCAMGALDSVERDYGCLTNVLIARDRLVHEIGMTITNWNDDPSRTQEEVVEMMLYVARKERDHGDLADS